MIREHYKESKDVEGALRRMPHHMVAERSVVSKCLLTSTGGGYCFYIICAIVTIQGFLLTE